MFEKHRAKKAAQEYQAAFRTWSEQREACVALVQIAQEFHGQDTDEIMLKPGEALIFKVTNTSLIEERSGKGHYQGGSTGVSIPIGSIGGRSIRYRVGASRGHYVQGVPSPTAIDTGTTFITNQRVIFEGGRQTRECLFAKLIGVTHAAGETVFSVTNRQKPTTIHYGSEVSAPFIFRLDLALAQYKGTVDQFVLELQNELNQLDAARPRDPTQSPSLP